MNKTTRLLRIIQIFRVLINPLFAVPLQLNASGFSASKKRTALLACYLIAIFAAKIYFLTLYKLQTTGFFIEMYHLAVVTFLSGLSYVGYATNSSSIAKILNSILSQSRPIAGQVICRKVRVIAVVQLVIVVGIPFAVTVWCNSDPFFYSDEVFWLYTMDIWLAFIVGMHLTASTVLFSNGVLLSRQSIAKVNNELVKMNRIDWQDYIQMDLMKKEKVEGLGRLDMSEEELAVIMSMYNSVCQNCADLNASYGCSLSCTYISNLLDMILVAFYTIKYGAAQLWIFIVINFCYFLNIWFVLFACESFTKEILDFCHFSRTRRFLLGGSFTVTGEHSCLDCLPFVRKMTEDQHMQKTGIIVNRLMLETKNEKEKELYQQFSIFLLHRKIKFTAWGLFNLDYKIVYSTLSMAVTYLSIVHQFETKYSS